MGHGIISADCHMDLMFVPEDTFTARAPAGWRDRMPRIVENDDGFAWVAGERGELRLGTWASQGSRVWSGVRGRHMREAGYAPEDRRPANPEKRLADLERDGVDAEVIYGIFQLQNHVSDGDLVAACFTAYNQFITEFCATHPTRFFGLGCLPGHTVEGGRPGAGARRPPGPARRRVVLRGHLTPRLASPVGAPLGRRRRAQHPPLLPRPHQGNDDDGRIRAGGQPGLHRRLQRRRPDAARRSPGVGADVRRAGALPRPAEWCWPKAASAGSPTCWSAPTTSGRTTSMSTGAPSRRRPASSSDARCTPRSRRTPWDRPWPRSGADSFMWGSDYPHEDGVWPDSHEAIGRYWATSARRCAASWSRQLRPPLRHRALTNACSSLGLGNLLVVRKL